MSQGTTDPGTPHWHRQHPFPGKKSAGQPWLSQAQVTSLAASFGISQFIFIVVSPHAADFHPLTELLGDCTKWSQRSESDRRGMRGFWGCEGCSGKCYSSDTLTTKCTPGPHDKSCSSTTNRWVMATNLILFQETEFSWGTIQRIQLWISGHLPLHLTLQMHGERPRVQCIHSSKAIDTCSHI